MAVLEARAWTPEVSAHLAACGSCKLVMELIEERGQAAASRDRRAACAKFEALLAVRVDGCIGTTAADLLDQHLEDCDDCRAIAETMAPVNDRTNDQASLATIDRSVYALGSEVARGGMARVISARDLRIGRPVAVKEPLANTSTQTARFEREARVTARLQHPGIVPIYEIGRWSNGTPFYSMRMVAGRTLRAELANRKTVAERLALLPAVIMACDAVAFAHANRVIHRDLTPSNIMVGEYGETVVIDWGLAKDLGDETAGDDNARDPYRDDPRVADDLTVDGAIIGTASYMPPEQAIGDEVDERADVYSLGAILYHLLAGNAPYRGRNEAVLAAVTAGPPPAVRDAPRDLISIVDKAMSRDPAARYPSARELAVELTAFQAGRLVEAHSYSRGELARRWIRRHRAAVVGASATLLALVVTGAIGIVGVVSARDRAERGEQAAVEQRTAAEHANADLLEDEGRQALLAGKPVQASVWLSAAYTAGNRSAPLRFLLGSAMRDVESVERKLDCGSEISRVELSPDGANVLVACEDSVRVWRIADGAPVFTFASPHAHFRAAYSHDGRSLLAWSKIDDKTRVWDATTGALRYMVAGKGASFSPDDRLIQTSVYPALQLWDATSGTLLRTIDASTPEQPWVRGQFFGNDRLVSITTTGVMKVWDVASGRLLRTISNNTPIVSGDLDTGSVNHVVAVCGADSVAKIWNLDTGALVGAFAGHTDMVWTCSRSPDGALLVTTSNDGTAKVWNVASGKIEQSFAQGGIVFDGQLSKDGQTIVTAGMTGFRIWDVASGALLGADDAANTGPGRVALTDERLLVASDATLTLWRHPGRTRARAFHAPPNTMIALASADGTRAAVDDHVGITLWNVDTGKALAHAPLHAPVVTGGELVAARGATGIVVLDLRAGATRATLPTGGDPIELGADGRFLAVREGAHRSAVWDVTRGVEVAHWDGNWQLGGLATGSDRIAARASGDNATHAEVWALDPPRLVQHLRGDVGFSSVIFPHDRGQIGLVGSNALTLWDLSTAQPIRAVQGAFGVRLDPAGSLAVGSQGGHLDVVRVADGAAVAGFSGISMIGWPDLTRDATFIGGDATIEGAVTLWDSTGRVLATLPHPRASILGEGTYQLGSQQVAFSRDGSRLISQDATEVVELEIPQEQRDPAEVARIVRARAPWTIEHGRLVPLSPKQARVHGRITRAGAPVPAATVSLRDKDSVIATAISSADGSYVIDGATAALAQIDAYSPAVGAFAAPRPIRLVAGDNAADIELDLAGSIAGVVVDAADKPVGGVHLHAERDSGGDHGDDTTAADGTFTITSLAGGGAYVLTSPDPARKLDLHAPIAVQDGATHVTGMQLVVRAASPP